MKVLSVIVRLALSLVRFSLGGCARLESVVCVHSGTDGSYAAPRRVDPARALGTAGPTWALAWAPDERWVVLCQARRDTNGDGIISTSVSDDTLKGDDMAPYLIRGAGSGEELGALLESSSDGRYLLVTKADKLWLLDTLDSRQDVDLSAHGASLSETLIHIERDWAGFFDKAGHLLYVSRGRVIMRELATGREQAFDLPGQLHKAFPHPAGVWLGQIHVEPGTEMKRDDPPRRAYRCHFPDDGNARFELPRGARRFLSFSPVKGGSPVLFEEENITPLGDLLLVKETSGAFVVRDAQGQRTELVPASCRGSLIHSHGPSRSVLVACMARKRRLQFGSVFKYMADVAPVEYHAPGRQVTYPLETTTLSRGVGENSSNAILMVLEPPGPDGLRKDSDRAIIDMTDGSLRRGPRGRQIYRIGPHLILHHEDDTLSVYNTESHRSRAIRPGRCVVDGQSSLLLVGEEVLDEQGEVLGHLPLWTGTPQAITRQGALLAAIPGPRWEIPQGPFWWEPIQSGESAR
jgi:hypothetical protein